MEKKKVRMKIQIESLHAVLKEDNRSCAKEILLPVSKRHYFPCLHFGTCYGVVSVTQRGGFVSQCEGSSLLQVHIAGPIDSTLPVQTTLFFLWHRINIWIGKNL